MTRTTDDSQFDHLSCRDQLSPNRTTNSSNLSPQPWYKYSLATPHGEKSDSREADIAMLTAASTPLAAKNGMTTFFPSPLRNLHMLDLNSSSPQRREYRGLLHDHNTYSNSINIGFQSLYDSELHEQNQNSSDTSIGDLTFAETLECNGLDESDPVQYIDPPIFVRKRKLDDPQVNANSSPSVSSIKTPSANRTEDISGFIEGTSHDSTLKGSYLASDSTPCPAHPRKKLKSKSHLHEITPSQPSKIMGLLLNFNSSRKVQSDASFSKRLKINESESLNKSPIPVILPSGVRSISVSAEASTIPIGQSTPTNSRSNSPHHTGYDESDEANEKFVVKGNPKFSYQTPQPRIQSQPSTLQQRETLKTFINEHDVSGHSESPIGNYEIVGNFPISAAGLMNEDGEDVHIADKRINDPYVSQFKRSTKVGVSDLLRKYMDSWDRLPIKEHFKRELGQDEMLQLINDGESIKLFYEQVFPLGGNEFLNFLKKERLRWHPDKRAMRQQGLPFDESIHVQLIQVINNLISENR